MAITSILYNECLRRRCVIKKGNVAQVEFYNIDDCKSKVYYIFFMGFLIFRVFYIISLRASVQCVEKLQPRFSWVIKKSRHFCWVLPKFSKFYIFAYRSCLQRFVRGERGVNRWGRYWLYVCAAL